MRTAIGGKRQSEALPLATRDDDIKILELDGEGKQTPTRSSVTATPKSSKAGTGKRSPTNYSRCASRGTGKTRNLSPSQVIMKLTLPNLEQPEIMNQFAQVEDLWKNHLNLVGTSPRTTQNSQSFRSGLAAGQGGATSRIVSHRKQTERLNKSKESKLHTERNIGSKETHGQ